MKLTDCEYETLDDVPADDCSWGDWKDSVRAEGWFSCGDDSTLAIIPGFATTRVVLARQKAGKH